MYENREYTVEGIHHGMTSQNGIWFDYYEYDLVDHLMREEIELVSEGDLRKSRW